MDSSVVSGRGLEATEVVANPLAGLAAGFFFFFAPAMMIELQGMSVTINCR
jgi:hypothetical protein